MNGDSTVDPREVELPDVGRVTLEDAETGEIVEVNEALADNPGLVNEDPQGDAWFFKIKPSDPAQMDDYMDEAAYKKFIG